MSDLICDTSSIQYLHQLGLLHILTSLGDDVLAPPAVMDELSVGRSLGVDLPTAGSLKWLMTQQPVDAVTLPLSGRLGPGETQVLTLALEMSDAVAILDDALARKVAEMLNVRFTGTLGLLLDAKEVGLVDRIHPLLDQLNALQFRLAQHTYELVLRLAGEA